MIKRILSVAILLFAVYSIFINWFAPKWWHSDQNQWKGNIIEAQRFIYDRKDSFTSVVVGSSLAYRLHFDLLPKTYNLTFSGQSIYDGLNILCRESPIPKNIFIEMNYPINHEKMDFRSSVYSRVLFYPKKVFLSLRDDRQPLGILGDQIDAKIMQPLLTGLRSLFHISTAEETSNGGVSDELFLKLLKVKTKEYAQAPDKNAINKCFPILKARVTELEKKGAHIIFFEMPVDSQLVSMPKAKSIRELFYSNFPPSEYEYITVPDSGQWKTTDGTHLVKKESLRYTLYFRSMASPYKQLAPKP